MLMVVAGICLALWIVMMAWRFYHSIDWDEPVESGPDLQALHKRAAELRHVQDVLTEAHSQGKLSEAVLAEYNRFCEAEVQAMQAIETAWKNRRKTKPSPA